MLSVEHVSARRAGERLVLRELSPKQRRRALELAEQLLETSRASAGRTRDELEQAFTLVEARASERKLLEGLKKLIEDASEFEQHTALDPAAIRREVFARAARARREFEPERPTADRAEILRSAAAELGLAESEIESLLYADLRGAHRLVRPATLSPEELVVRFERAQVQALLLRATEVEATVRCKNPELYRALFHKLKFRRLLYRLEPLDDGGYRLLIDGPFSLFEAVVKYGLELALLLPALEECDVLELRARVLWGKARTPLVFEHRRLTRSARVPSAPALRDELAQLMSEFNALGSEWRCAPAEEVLSLPGQGACVPDLIFERPPATERLYFELLGYWSRDAVWRRVELVEQGLSQPIVFGVSHKLRVSEAVLDSEHAALYVFRGSPSARALLRKLEDLRPSTSA